MQSLRFTCLTLLILITASASAWAGESRYESRIDQYQAQARRYVADRTRRVEPRTRYVNMLVTYTSTVPTRQRMQAPFSDHQLQAQPVHNASLLTPTRITIQDIDAADQSRVRDGVIHEQTLTAPVVSHFAGYEDDQRTTRTTQAVYLASPRHDTYSNYTSYRAYNSPAYYSSSYYGRDCDRDDYRRPNYRVGVIYRDGWDQGYYRSDRYRCRPNYGRTRFGYRHHYPRYPRRCGPDWGFSIFIRF